VFSGEAANASTNLIVFGLNQRGLEANTETLWVRDRVMFMVFNATLSNISVISWKSVLFVEEKRLGDLHKKKSHK
jgi:hypothetical protein